jgi:hypothetical protein
MPAKMLHKTQQTRTHLQTALASCDSQLQETLDQVQNVEKESQVCNLFFFFLQRRKKIIKNRFFLISLGSNVALNCNLTINITNE